MVQGKGGFLARAGHEPAAGGVFPPLADWLLVRRITGRLELVSSLRFLEGARKMGKEGKEGGDRRRPLGFRATKPRRVGRVSRAEKSGRQASRHQSITLFGPRG